MVSLSLCELIQSFGLLQTLKQSYFFVNHKNYGRIEIVGILLARLKYMSGSENVYMQIISGCCKNIYINHDFCKTISIILVNLLTWYSCLILICLHRAGDANHV